MKKLSYLLSVALAGLFFTSCTEDYTDWAAQPAQYEGDEAVTIPGFTAMATGTIDLRNIAGDEVDLLALSKAALPEDYTIQNIRAEILPDGASANATPRIIKANENGKFSKTELQEAIETMYNSKRPVNRVFNAHVYANAKKNGQAVLIDAGTIQLNLTPEAPYIAENYYLIGGTLDWAESAKNKTQKFSHSGKDVYDDPIFTIVINAAEGDTWFAISDDAGCEAIANDNDWSKLLGTTDGNGNNGLTGTLDYRYNLSDDGSLKVPAGNKLIKITLDMMDYSFTIEPVNISESYYLIGGPGEWNAESAKTMKFSHSDNNVVDDPVFTYVFAGTGSEMWFAFGDEDAINNVGEGVWNKLFGTKGDSKDLNGSFDYRYNLDDDHSFCVDGTAKYYRFQVNMAEMTYTITPLNFAEYFYEIGNESSWSTSHALYGGNGDGKYQGYYYLDGEFKFKPNESGNDWSDDLEYVSGDNMSGTLQSSGGPNCPDPGAGFYRINLDAANLTYTLTKIEQVSIIGTANGNWDTDTDLTYNKEEGCWEVTCDLNAGEMKFRGNHNWNGDVDLGGSFDNLIQGGSNIAVEAGNYTIKLYISIPGKHKAVVTKN